MNQLPSLTAIRGIAAMAVLFFHIHDTFPTNQLGFFHLFRHGDLGVDLFFLLSGFIMAHVYSGTSVAGDTWTFTRHFLAARLARIYPLHLVTLMSVGLIALILPGYYESHASQITWLSFALNLLLVQSWGLIRSSWNLVSWSISAEWFMYLMFPLILRTRQRFPRAGKSAFIAMALGILCVHYGLITLKGWDGYGPGALGSLVRVSAEFTFGFLCYQVRQCFPVPRGTAFELLCACAFASAGVAFFVDGWWLLFVPSCALVIILLSYESGIASRMLSWRPFVALGEVSYSLYMWHWIIIQIFNVLRGQGTIVLDPGSDKAAQAAGVVLSLVSLVAAWISFVAIERPARAWARGLAAR